MTTFQAHDTEESNRKLSSYIDWLDVTVDTYIGEEEIAPETGQRHIHIAFKVNNALHFRGLWAILRSWGVWIEPARSWKGSVAYCQKEYKRIPDQYENGDLRFFVRGKSPTPNLLGLHMGG